MYDAIRITKQLYPNKKADVIIALIAKATSDYAINRILKDAREGKVRA
jgi:hypothetical protein